MNETSRMQRNLERQADWLPVVEAIERILGAVRRLPAEHVPLLGAPGRTLAENVVSPIDHPPWDNSAMDGFAVLAADIAGASQAAPVVLDIIEDVPAGGFPTRSMEPGTAVRVMTGAPVPAGTDTVVRVEHTRPVEGDPNQIRVVRGADAGRNVRPRGEDLRVGDPVVSAGTVLHAAEMGLLATVGHGVVRVTRRPRLAILSNGDELVDLNDFDQVGAGRRIVNSNAYSMAGAVAAAGGEPILLGIAGDDEGSIREHLEASRDADALITTAGASVGEHDLMKGVLEERGFALDFWRVQMKPGSPFSFGHLDGMPVFGLPGNPVSALVTFEVLVRPALRRMLGRRAVHTPTFRVRTAEAVKARPRKTQFLRATLEDDGRGGRRARLTGPQGSGILSSMTRANVLLVVPAGPEAVPAGAELTAIPLPVPDDGVETPGL
ncbi:MAG: molybdopterin molybdotransferase MoeA [Gemmatimonadota bacterium]